MNLFITGDRQEFCSESFYRRLHEGLAKLGIEFKDITRVIRTAYGGTELRAQEMAETYGIKLEQIPVPEGYGKMARFAATNQALTRADAVIVFDSKGECQYVDHSKRAAAAAEIPNVVV